MLSSVSRFAGFHIQLGRLICQKAYWRRFDFWINELIQFSLNCSRWNSNVNRISSQNFCGCVSYFYQKYIPNRNFQHYIVSMRFPRVCTLTVHIHKIFMVLAVNHDKISLLHLQNPLLELTTNTATEDAHSHDAIHVKCHMHRTQFFTSSLLPIPVDNDLFFSLNENQVKPQNVAFDSNVIRAECSGAIDGGKNSMRLRIEFFLWQSDQLINDLGK